VLSKCTVQQ